MATTASSTLTYYPGSRRLPNLQDGREVWQAYVGSAWRTYYELPMDATDLGRIQGRLPGSVPPGAGGSTTPWWKRSASLRSNWLG